MISPEDADGMFDVLTYEKGASVVRMLEQYLGEDTFREGIRGYMARHQYGNTETSDLWDALEEASGEPVRRIAESWIFRGGFPEVSVARDGGDTVRFTQAPFGYAESTSDARWAVPLIVGRRDGGSEGGADGDGEQEVRLLLDGESAEASLPAAEWPTLVANFGAHGFYRTRYAPDLLAGLLADLGAMTPLERYVLVDDAWASVLAGTTSRRRLPGAGRGVRPRDRPVGVGAHRRRAQRARPPGRRRRARPCSPAASGCWPTPPGGGSATTCGPTTTTAPSRCAACCSTRRPCWPTTRRRGTTAGRCSTGSSPTPRASSRACRPRR